jgi:hypothetical protein
MTFSISHPEAAPVALSANPAFVVDFLDRFKNFPAFFTPLENFSVTERLNVFISQKSFASVALPLIASGIASIVLRAAPFFIALADDVAPLIFPHVLSMRAHIVRPIAASFTAALFVVALLHPLIIFIYALAAMPIIVRSLMKPSPTLALPVCTSNYAAILLIARAIIAIIIIILLVPSYTSCSTLALPSITSP